MRYQHLFFDLDHTLWDFETNAKSTLRELFDTHRLHETVTPQFDEFFSAYSYHNKRLWDRYHHGFIRQEELKWKRMWHALLEFKLGDEKLAKQLSADFLEILPGKKELFPHTIEILEYLTGKGYQLHLITNGFEKIQWSKLRTANIGHYFKAVITSELANSLKPKKEIFNFAMLQTGASLKESVMLGDNLDADISGALNAGMDAIFVNHIREETTIKPTHTIYHLRELEQIL
ncbi:noncanonical pyrimidine nucleotidase, YjjG family [Segetibacter sp. 3557_3]|uniref:YjjG family noncanonical pyrimidine nucleotidase n=1 Tax=Segetibacter sp. 3557_3 TaxID=2547429 RepID=UPI001058A8EE|nr:YjjG family noncanonical pyrimidine nucleotidase [Segetibacter sp. 3557_3]TDH18353.1 noncanonical pyrimidine nucleotidase, YjjG family [Segetibacter sp. 3557_3]